MHMLLTYIAESNNYLTMFHICRTIRRHSSLRQVKLCIGQRKYEQTFTTQGRKDRPTDQASEFALARSLNSYFEFCKIVGKKDANMSLYVRDSSKNVEIFKNNTTFLIIFTNMFRRYIVIVIVLLIFSWVTTRRSGWNSIGIPRFYTIVVMWTTLFSFSTRNGMLTFSLISLTINILIFISLWRGRVTRFFLFLMCS